MITQTPGHPARDPHRCVPLADVNETTVIGTATLGRGTTVVPLRSGPPTRYLLVWITRLAGSENHYQSTLSKIEIQCRTT